MTYDEEQLQVANATQQKMIIVSIWFRGKTHWRQMKAVRAGKRYVVDAESMDKWLDDIGIQRGQTFTVG